MIRWSPFVFLVLLAVACSSDPQPQASESPQPGPTQSPTPVPAATTPPASGPFARIACGLPPAEIQRVWAGYNPERSGDIQFVPEEPNYVGNFASHSGPWPYLQEVPMFLYGPGHVPGVGRISRPVTMADLAPTLAQHLGFPFDAPDGEPLQEAVDPAATPPKLILTVVWDGGGRDVLDAYPKEWPTVRGLIPDGAWYDDATVGSSPSVTPAIHSTLGTGAFPRTHGIVDLRFRVEGRVEPSAFERATLMIGPTMTDLYDVAQGNQPVIGMVGAEGTLGMIGHGALWEGGDRDIAAGQRAGEWGLADTNLQNYEFPRYVRDLPGLDEAIRGSDEEDGSLDGLWMGDLDLSIPDAQTLTPGYAEYQTGVIQEIIRREGFGADDIPDLLFVNYKQIDKVGHKYSFPSPQMERVVQSSDQAFADLIEMLDREVGEGQWVMALTADHGSTPNPETTGAIIVDNFELNRDLLAEFDGDGDDRPVIQSLRVTQAWVDIEELQANGFTIEDMGRYLIDYTRAENTVDPSTLAAGEGDVKLFAAAFPGDVLETALPCLQP